MKDKKKWAVLIALSMAIIITIIIRLFDVGLIKFIAGLRNEILDYIFLSVTFASNVFIIFFFLTTLFLWKEHKRRWIFPLWFSSLLSVLISIYY